MASFQKRGRTWQYTVSRVVNGKSKPIRKGGFRTKKEAQVAASEIESKLSRGVLPQLKPVPINEYFEEWKNLYKSHLSETTRYHYNFTLKHIKKIMGDISLQEITKDMYQRYINEYGKKRSKATVNMFNTHIRSCANKAIEDGIIAYDFTRGVILNATEGEKKPIDKYINYEDSKRLLDLVTKKLDGNLYHYAILLALTSGMRFSEIVGLTKRDFCFKNNIISINKKWGYKKTMESGFGVTKNEDSNRIVEMDNKTMDIFKKLFKEQPNNEHNLVFYIPISKYKTLDNTTVNRSLARLLKELGIDEITFHGLRHTHVSILIYKKEVTLNYISERIGHKNLDTTLKVYSHVLKELRKEDSGLTTDVFSDLYEDDPEE